MPWKASSVMEEKVRFVVEYEREGLPRPNAPNVNRGKG